MAMFIRAGSGPHAEINMTPMIDVLLVLIIIFMIVSPHERGLDTAVPQPSSSAPQDPAPVSVVTVQSGGLMLNREVMDRSTLASRLKGLVANGRGDVLFVRGVGDLEFAQVAEVIDLAHVAGIGRIALMPE